MEKAFFVYIMTNQRNGTLYIGVTSNLIQRVWQHKEKLIEGFSQRHGLNQLVWFESHADAMGALTREKQLKKWNRAWKLRLIEALNPGWKDLYPSIT
ncbi:MAG: GIY-YIG nuclease family protein [Burkholderiales bacterium]|nr:GIY-YIG nuclease family protein [Burkholderiales bacterium]MBK8667421.1 GIY-YIG nuclease family protein [Burkholderiales bacterium]